MQYINNVELRGGSAVWVSSQTESLFWVNKMNFSRATILNNHSIKLQNYSSEAQPPKTPKGRIESGIKEAQGLEERGEEAKAQEMYSDLFWNTPFSESNELKNSPMKVNLFAFRRACIEESCNNAAAWFLAGKIYFEGDSKHNIKQNRRDALESFKKSFIAGYQPAFETLKHTAEQKCPEANYQLYDIYSQGKGDIVANSDIAFDYLKTAADLGHSQAQLDIAKIFASKQSSQSRATAQDNFAEAVKYYELAAKDHSKQAHLGLAKLYVEKGNTEDIKIAISYFNKANANAELHTLSKALCEDAVKLLKSDNRSKSNEEDAKNRLLLAAGLGSADANFELGKIYESRIEALTFVYKKYNEDKAFNYFKVAADSKPPHTEAAVKVGKMFEKKGDSDSAIPYYEIAAKKDNIEAKAKLGDKVAAYQKAQMLQNINPNDPEVIAYYHMAEALNHTDAQFELGQIYELRSKELSMANLLNNENREKALEYYQKAANATPAHEKSALKAAKIHEEIGNKNLAKRYYRIASELGNEEATSKLDDAVLNKTSHSLIEEFCCETTEEQHSDAFQNSSSPEKTSSGYA